MSRLDGQDFGPKTYFIKRQTQGRYPWSGLRHYGTPYWFNKRFRLAERNTGLCGRHTW